jgi:LemA protein
LVLYILIAVIVLMLVFVFKTYNGLISMRNNLHNAWSDIDVLLTRRHDLVPNLVESVKGYMTHERQTLEAVTAARSAAMQTGGDVVSRGMAEMALGNAVGNLFAKVERYPELKASQSFILLQEQITSTENRIAFARQHYNETVRQFNTKIAEFPNNLISGALGFTPEKLFAVDAGDRANAAVQI